MAYEKLLDELKRLKVRQHQLGVHHIGRRPATPSTLRRRGLSHIAAYASLLTPGGFPTSRRVADRMADEPFRWGGKCHPGRYSNGFPALYTAADLDGAIAEVRHHLEKAGAVAGGLRPRYLILLATIDGDSKDLLAFSRSARTQLVRDTDYRPTQKVGAAAHAEPLAYLTVPSARARGHRNHPVFSRPAVRADDAKRTIEFFLDGAGTFAWNIKARTR